MQPSTPDGRKRREGSGGRPVFNLFLSFDTYFPGSVESEVGSRAELRVVTHQQREPDRIPGRLEELPNLPLSERPIERVADLQQPEVS